MSRPRKAPVELALTPIDPELAGIDYSTEYLTMDEVKDRWGGNMVAQTTLILQKRIGDAFFMPTTDNVLVRRDFLAKVEEHLDPVVPY